MPQPLLETRQNVSLRSGLDIDDPSTGQSGLFKRGTKHILAGDDPQHFAACPGRDPGDELSGCRTMQRIIAATSHFMESPQREPSPWQTTVDLPHAKRQNRPTPVRMTFQTADGSTQRLQSWFHVGRSTHCTGPSPLVWQNFKVVCSCFVLI